MTDEHYQHNCIFIDNILSTLRSWIADFNETPPESNHVKTWEGQKNTSNIFS